MHSALVMQDKETDSYWSIMTGDSVAGTFRSTRLVELPLGVKAQWKDWVRDHPDTAVLSVDGREHIDTNPYDNYFGSDEGFRGSEARDTRLPTKQSIYAFLLAERKFAVPFSAFEGGGTFEAARHASSCTGPRESRSTTRPWPGAPPARVSRVATASGTTSPRAPASTQRIGASRVARVPSRSASRASIPSGTPGASRILGPSCWEPAASTTLLDRTIWARSDK